MVIQIPETSSSPTQVKRPSLRFQKGPPAFRRPASALEEAPETAESMARKQREISVSEFFLKNRHLLGLDNPRKALLTTVKEAVDNSLDACEESGILPDVVVEIAEVVRQVDGAEDVFVSQNEGVQYLELDIDRAAVGRLGGTAGKVVVAALMWLVVLVAIFV